MQRPTIEAVRTVSGTDADDALIAALIDDAVLIGECLKPLTGDRQSAALKWLTAHLLIRRGERGRLSAESLGDASWTYEAASVNNLRSTAPGRQAILIAPCLARRGNTVDIQVL